MTKIKLPVLVITGTSKGIGRGLAEFYCNNGYEVCGCSRSESNFSHPNYHHTQLDITQELEVKNWITGLRKSYGEIDSLICNAGSVKSALLLSTTPGNLAKEFLDIHFLGTFFVCREVSKSMIQQNYGRILNISTIGIPLHLEGTAVYSASKSAVAEMTKIMAKELAPLGITCNVLAPSLFLSESALKLGDKWASDLLSKQTIKRYASIHDIVNAVSFLISRDSSLITGQVINMGIVD
jgi:3-oxoacyl-[acyl-carrier protein] reductase